MAKQREIDASLERAKESLRLMIAEMPLRARRKRFAESGLTQVLKEVPAACSDSICAGTKGAGKGADVLSHVECICAHTGCKGDS